MVAPEEKLTIHQGDCDLSSEWAKILQAKGIIQIFETGSPHHVMYEGGKLHSDVSFNINKLLADRRLLDAVTQALLREWSKRNHALPDAVCSHTPYGRPLAESLGTCLKKPVYIYVSETSLWEESRAPPPHSKCIIVGDDALSGGRLTRLATATGAVSAMVIEPALVLADLSHDWERSFSVLAAFKRKASLWSPDNCPLCRLGSIPRRRIDLM